MAKSPMQKKQWAHLGSSRACVRSQRADGELFPPMSFPGSVEYGFQVTASTKEAGPVSSNVTGMDPFKN